MADLDNNGIDDDAEAAAYKAEAVNAKFRQTVASGIGAALVFGLVSAVGNALVVAANTAIYAAHATTFVTMISAAALPLMGLAALGVVGVSLLYLGAKFLSENTLLDQKLQATLINGAGRGKEPVIEVTPPTVDTKPPGFPAAGMVADAAQDAAAPADLAKDDAPAMAETPAPLTTIGERERSEPMIAREAVNDNIPQTKPEAADKPESWTDKTASADKLAGLTMRI